MSEYQFPTNDTPELRELVADMLYESEDIPLWLAEDFHVSACITPNVEKAYSVAGDILHILCARKGLNGHALYAQMGKDNYAATLYYILETAGPREENWRDAIRAYFEGNYRRAYTLYAGEGAKPDTDFTDEECRLEFEDMLIGAYWENHGDLGDSILSLVDKRSWAPVVVLTAIALDETLAPQGAARFMQYAQRADGAETYNGLSSATAAELLNAFLPVLEQGELINANDEDRLMKALNEIESETALYACLPTTDSNRDYWLTSTLPVLGLLYGAFGVPTDHEPTIAFLSALFQVEPEELREALNR